MATNEGPTDPDAALSRAGERFSGMGDRFKAYEAAAGAVLTRRVPVIVRADGRAFHSITRRAKRPYDPDVAACMVAAAKAMASDTHGCTLAYMQSDEVSLLVTDYAKPTTQAHFGYRVAKMVSTTAAVASVAFDREASAVCPLLLAGRPPAFDARAFNVPADDVVNYFVWRQWDAERNALIGLVQTYYSAKDCHGKGRTQQHDMLRAAGVAWSEVPPEQKYGVMLTRRAGEGTWIAAPAPDFRAPVGRTLVLDALGNAPGYENPRRVALAIGEALNRACRGGGGL